MYPQAYQEDRERTALKTATLEVERASPAWPRPATVTAVIATAALMATDPMLTAMGVRESPRA
jgi:hypothetical protein